MPDTADGAISPSATAPPDPVPVDLRVGNWNPASYAGSELSETEVDERILEHQLALLDCLMPGEVVVVVEGLLAVSKVYRSSAEHLAVSGFAFEAGPNAEVTSDVGRCFAGSKEAGFQTKVTETFGIDISDADQDDDESELVTQQITVDVGVTVSGAPFAAVVRERGLAGADDGSPFAATEVTHNYEPAEYRSNAVVEVVAKPGPEFTGVAVFSSTSYNNREYSPYTASEWPGSPKYNFTITVLCG